MNKILTLFTILFVWVPRQTTAQSTIYYQNFDGVTVPALPSFWSSNTATTQTMNNTSYSGMVNDQNLFLANCQPSGQLRTVTLSNVNTTNMQDITINFAHRRTNAFDTPITFEWSSDGTNWNNIAYSIPGSSSIWEFYASPTLDVGANNQANLRFRWSWTTNTNSGCATAVPNFRLDEVIVAAFPLPISLLDFRVQGNPHSNSLYFTTASERNNAYFSIERSADGNTFAEIAQVRGAGNSFEPKNYAYTDEHPLNGLNYYRLRQVDFDGSGTYSRVLSARVGKTGNLLLLPTPATDQLRLVLEEPPSEGASYEVFDQLGRLILQGSFTTENIEQEMDVASLAKGVYVLRLKSGQAMMAKQFLKQ